jgi:hypothetical protein
MAINSNRLAGTAQIYVDGQSYMLAADLTYSPSRVKRDTLVGQDAVHGFSEMPSAPFIAGTFRDAASLTVADFNAMTDVTVVCTLANGKTVTGVGMWTTDVQEVKTQEGTFEVRFEGKLVEEV